MNQLERTQQRTEGELLEAFAECKRLHGSDLGLMFMALHLEAEQRVAELELRLGKLEAAKRR